MIPNRLRIINHEVISVSTTFLEFINFMVMRRSCHVTLRWAISTTIFTGNTSTPCWIRESLRTKPLAVTLCSLKQPTVFWVVFGACVELKYFEELRYYALASFTTSGLLPSRAGMTQARKYTKAFGSKAATKAAPMSWSYRAGSHLSRPKSFNAIHPPDQAIYQRKL